jgi:hypothetical protein
VCVVLSVVVMSVVYVVYVRVDSEEVSWIDGNRSEDWC